MLAPSAKHREVFGESRVNCIFPRTARETDFGTLCLLPCLWMTAPMIYSLFSGVPTPKTAMGVAMELPRGCLTIFTLRDAIIFGVSVLHPAQYDI